MGSSKGKGKDMPTVNVQRLDVVQKKTSNSQKEVIGSTRKNMQTTKRDSFFANSQRFHLLKKQILVPFLTKLILKKRYGDFVEGLDEECTISDPGMFETGNHSDARDLTLGMITDEHNASDADASSHHGDWRNDSDSDLST